MSFGIINSLIQLLIILSSPSNFLSSYKTPQILLTNIHEEIVRFDRLTTTPQQLSTNPIHFWRVLSVEKMSKAIYENKRKYEEPS